MEVECYPVFLGSPPPGQGFYYYSFGAALLDSTYNVAFVDTFPSSGYDHVTSYQKYGGLFASNDPYDYITADSVLYVQAGKFIQYDNYGSKDSTAMYLYNFNARKGRMNWMRKVPRNFPNGSHAVAALPGNRWAVSFTEYNWQKYPGQNLAVHVWVLNGNGDIISKEEFESPVRKLAVYPNPVNERLYLRKAPSLQGAVSFKIFGINGNMVDSGTIDSGERFIEVGDLSHGSYTLFLQGSRMEGVAKFQKM
ncbi:MAG: T9SS type A sorting domain-containing protein [Owenweeksia sp.]|nr:T9SS type A sorting domain-containing protein [Owenweeksia sp.]